MTIAADGDEIVVIHTDGACSGNPGPGGWAAVLSWRGRERELSGASAQTTNNIMELTAAIMALEALTLRLVQRDPLQRPRAGVQHQRVLVGFLYDIGHVTAAGQQVTAQAKQIHRASRLPEQARQPVGRSRPPTHARRR